MASFNTPYATLSFPHLFTKRARAEGANPVFTASFIFGTASQKSPAYKALVDGCIAAAKDKFGANVNLKTVAMPFRDAGDKADKFAGYSAGDMYVNAWSDNKPGIVDARRQDVLLPEEVWAGQLVRANLTPFAWTNSGKKGVSLGLNHIQIIRTDTPRIDGRASASAVFDDGEVAEPAENMF
jgi:hypothetical protein